MNSKLISAFVEAFDREPDEGDDIMVESMDIFHMVMKDSIVFAFVSEGGTVKTPSEMGFSRLPYWDSQLKILDK